MKRLLLGIAIASITTSSLYSITALDVTFSTPKNTSLKESLSGSWVIGGIMPYTFHFSNVVNGAITYSDPVFGTFNFVPNSGFVGIASFDYLVTDANDDNSAGVVTINVGQEKG